LSDEGHSNPVAMNSSSDDENNGKDLKGVTVKINESDDSNSKFEGSNAQIATQSTSNEEDHDDEEHVNKEQFLKLSF